MHRDRFFMIIFSQRWSCDAFTRLFVSLFAVLFVFYMAYDMKILNFSETKMPTISVSLFNQNILQCRGGANHLDQRPRPLNDSEMSVRYTIERDTASFYIETTASTVLNYRQACSIESLALRNPNLTIYVLTTGEIDRHSSTFNALFQYQNIAFCYFDIADFVSGSELEHWYNYSRWNESKFAIHHLSDAIRFLTLKKYGGYYFDLDLIHVKPVTTYHNFVAAESETTVAIGAMHFTRGHPVINDVVITFPIDYNPDMWSYAGIGLLTRKLSNYCNETNVLLMTPEKCKGFKILHPSKSFYPISYPYWENFFKEVNVEFDELLIGAHVWNFLSSGTKVKKESNQLYVQLARKSCPLVLDLAPMEF